MRVGGLTSRPGLRIGLLGGSFNPAHDGHRYISGRAIRQLGLDQVWWLVSPQNPLKPAAGMAPFEDRLAAARAVTGDRRIVVTDIERQMNTRYTADTVSRLRRRFPRQHFVWIMGADNLAEIPRWRRWPRIFATVPVAVFDRPSYALRALAGAAARRYRSKKVAGRHGIRHLVTTRAPAWSFIRGRGNRASATAIRARRPSTRK